MQNKAFIAVHSGEPLCPWASGYIIKNYNLGKNGEWNKKLMQR